MPTLHWIGKDKVVNHHHDVPFSVLNKVETFVAPEGTPANSTDNRIIHGDNLAVLKSLLPEFEGRVNCIYIDPPYNTGGEGWIYNDNVNDPRIIKWLGEVVGKEGEDLTRHDKWLCMMYPRLKLLRRLLADDGVIFVSIDDDEYANLKLVMDEVFGRNNRLVSFVWKSDGNFDNQAKIKNCHEYVLMYTKKPELFVRPNVVDPSVSKESKLFKDHIINTIVKNGKKNPVSSITLPCGFPCAESDFIIEARQNKWPKMDVRVEAKNYKTVSEFTVTSGWSSKTLLEEFISSNMEAVVDQKGQVTRFHLTKNGAVESVKERPQASHVISFLSQLGTTQSQQASLQEMGFEFPYPKPVNFIEYLISLLSKKDSIILDSFAGSGTTAHAVLKLNADGGNRRFILCEMENYADTITAERVRRVMSGYGEDSKRTKGLGGGFDYYIVGEKLFLDDKNLNESVGAVKIRDYVAYSEKIKPEQRTDQLHPTSLYTIGVSQTALWVFYYEPDNITTLDMDFLASLNIQHLPQRPESFVIYADKCTLEKEFMTKHGIIFKRIPRDITRF